MKLIYKYKVVLKNYNIGLLTYINCCQFAKAFHEAEFHCLFQGI